MSGCPKPVRKRADDHYGKKTTEFPGMFQTGIPGIVWSSPVVYDEREPQLPLTSGYYQDMGDFQSIEAAVTKARELTAGISEISDAEIDNILFDIPKVMSALNRILYKLENALTTKMAERKELARKLRAHYSGDAATSMDLGRPPHRGKVPVSAMASFVDTDELMMPVDAVIDRLKLAISAVEAELKTVSSIQWIIRIHTDRMKYVK